MSKSNFLEQALLELIFNGEAIANIADDADTSPLTDLYVSLHTSSPGEDGDQETNEISYTGYARVAVERTSGGWVVSGSSVSPAENIEFGQMTAGAGGTVTHAAIGTDSTGAGRILYYGAVSPSIVVSNGVIPRIGAGSTITED